MAATHPTGLRLIRHQAQNPPPWRRVGSSWYEWYSLDQHFGGQVSEEVAVGDDAALRAFAAELLPMMDRWEDGHLHGPRVSVVDEPEWVAVDAAGRPVGITYKQLRSIDRVRPVLVEHGH